MKKTRIRKFNILLLILMFICTTTLNGVVDTTVTFNKNEPLVTLSDEGERIFDIQYNFGVEFEYVTTGLDLVLVLDRSNSMLRPDPATGLPVADAVWKAVNDFVTEVYTAYPKSNIAIVSFGTNGNKSDNWKYYNNLEDTLEEIEDVYDYRDLYYNYHSNFASYSDYGYRYAWEYWQISDGATNIKAAFEYGETTVDHKQVVEEASGQDVIILFTDGVATQGGDKSQKNYNYPTAHNTNTIAAYEAGQRAQNVAEIITVGYFEGIEYESTKEVARDTLVKAQNAGLFEASQTNQLTSIFDTIVEELNYIGTDASVVEIIEDEFELVEGSIEPDNYVLSRDSYGRQVITWPLGNVTETNYEFGYKVKAKEDVYPTGSGDLEIPINEQAILYYTDLNGTLVSENLGQSTTTLPPISNQPEVSVDIVYENNQYGYLLGDVITIDHQMHFTNPMPFDYEEIHVENLYRTIITGDINNYLSLENESIDSGWATDVNGYVVDVDDYYATAEATNLEWNGNREIKVKTDQLGQYKLKYDLAYELINSMGTVFDFTTNGIDDDFVNVIEGTVVLDLVDNLGVSITNVQVYVDDVLATTSINANGDVVVHNVTSGTHEIKFELPSGYRLVTYPIGVTMNSNNDISFMTGLSYDTPSVTRTIEFERLNVKEIKITTRDNQHNVPIDQLNDIVPSKMSFTLTRPLIKVRMNMIDDFAGSNHKFTLDSTGTEAVVRNAAGNIVPGFSMDGSVLHYFGPELPVGTYEAYGQMIPPDLSDGMDYDYTVDVDHITTRELGDISDFDVDVTSDGLNVGVEDTEGPLITAVHVPEESSINLINQAITITDKTEIVTYEVYKGALSYEEIVASTELLTMNVTSQTMFEVKLNSDIPLELTTTAEGFNAEGSITVYAVDAFGNYSILVVDYFDDKIHELLDEDLI